MSAARLLASAEAPADPMCVAFRVSGKPEPQGSARAFVRGGRAVVTSDNTNLHSWRNLVAHEASKVVTEMLDGPVVVYATFYLLRSKSRPKRELFPAIKPDLDKLCRSLLDGITHVVIRDDSQVVSLMARKRWADVLTPPGVWVVVEEARQEVGE